MESKLSMRLVKVCPICGDKRPHTELYCGNIEELQDGCNYPLANVKAVDAQYKEQQKPVTKPLDMPYGKSVLTKEPDGFGEQAQSSFTGIPYQDADTVSPNVPTSEKQSPSHSLMCPNGHDMPEGDFLCPTCGEVVVALGGDREPAPKEMEDETKGDAPTDMTGEGHDSGLNLIPPNIKGWHIINPIESVYSNTNQWLVGQDDGTAEAVLRLYDERVQLDSEVYTALQKSNFSYVPHIYAFSNRTSNNYEILAPFEKKSLGLCDIDPESLDKENLYSIVDALCEALKGFSELGLRHRNLQPSNIIITLPLLDDLENQNTKLMITGFSDACLSRYDLEILPQLEVTRYMAPESLQGGISPASDWWSLGITLLELMTKGQCFEGIDSKVLLVHIMTVGLSVPKELDPDLSILLNGLLLRDPDKRWQGEEVALWREGKPPILPAMVSQKTGNNGSVLSLGGQNYDRVQAYVLAVAEGVFWDDASTQLEKGSLLNWLEEQEYSASGILQLKKLMRATMDVDIRLGLVLQLLYPDMPLLYKGKIVNPAWLMNNPEIAIGLLKSDAPKLHEAQHKDSLLFILQQRDKAVSELAVRYNVTLNKEIRDIYALSYSSERLLALWEERRQTFPDSDHRGILTLGDRRNHTDADLIVLLSAKDNQFSPIGEVLKEAQRLADKNNVTGFHRDDAEDVIRRQTRAQIFMQVGRRIADFVYTDLPEIDKWAADFRQERRGVLARALVLLSVPKDKWKKPVHQKYLYELIEFFQARVALSIRRGPLARTVIGKNSLSIDLVQLDSPRRPTDQLLNTMIDRQDKIVVFDPALFVDNPLLERRLHRLAQKASLHSRDTGIESLYIGFPFVVMQVGSPTTKPKIAPVLLWPVKLNAKVGRSGEYSVSFEAEREEPRLNPALKSFVGKEEAVLWEQATDDVLGRSGEYNDIIEAFSGLTKCHSTKLEKLPSQDVTAMAGEPILYCSAVLFHVAFMAQGVLEDLAEIQNTDPKNCAIETMLRMKKSEDITQDMARFDLIAEKDRFFSVASDPSQEAAVLRAREGDGLVIEGPPGTGKSQTIVNIVGDAIGRKKSLLIICQKQAALDVVRKRLEAEGLKERIATVKDVNRDRLPLIRSVREQIEELLYTPPDYEALANKRIEVSKSVESLEKQLDEHHQALHKIDPDFGRSYRQLLGELLTLEEDSDLVIPAIKVRHLVQDWPVETCLAVEQNCIPISPLWLASGFESSALQALKPFRPDKDVVEDFFHDFKVFKTLEKVRVASLEAGVGFEVSSLEAEQSWFDKNSALLKGLDQDQIFNLSYWHQADIAEVNTALKDCLVEAKGRCGAGTETKNTKFSLFLAELSDQDLEEYNSSVEQLLNKRQGSLFWWLNLAIHKKLRGFKARFEHFTFTTSLPDIKAVLGFIEQEAVSRPVRQGLQAILKKGGKSQKVVALLSLDQIIKVAEQTFSAVQKIRPLVLVVQSSPHSDVLADVLTIADQAQIETFLQDYERALGRARNRESSIEGLVTLESWMMPDWLSQTKAQILQNKPTEVFLDQIKAALPNIAAFQNFQLQATTLTPDDWAFLKQLRTIEKDLLVLPSPSQIQEAVRIVLQRELRLSWKEKVEKKIPVLFQSRTQQVSVVKKLAKQEKELRKLNRTLLIDLIDVNKLGSRKEWEAITRLRGARSKRLREFISLGFEVGLDELRPIWLMNPDVASRLLPIQKGLFDIVVFDEASQLPIEYALPCLYRGETVIVSGDEKQLPPTSFFAGSVVDEEEDDNEFYQEGDEVEDGIMSAEVRAENSREIKDCTDLLMLARSVLPKAMLQVHYRSHYRSLIAFSNAAFYNNKLNIPVSHSAERLASLQPIEMVRVNGIYENRTNQQEAECVVEQLKKMWCGKEKSFQSVGVVTFNKDQATLIQDVIEETLWNDEVFAKAYRSELQRTQGGEDMGFFVKNVENVQGDERDVIIFSTTFGYNPSGQFRRNFGVLGQRGGERRLNVAISRARDKVIIASSMPIADISDFLSSQQPANKPRDYLQAYLQFATLVSAGQFKDADALLEQISLLGAKDYKAGVNLALGTSVDDGFLSAIRQEIEQLGYHVEMLEGKNAFSLDLVVLDPQTGDYIMGIECDAHSHPILTHARAREIWRPRLLKQSIKHLHRVSSQGWYLAPEKEKALLHKQLETEFSDKTGKKETV